MKMIDEADFDYAKFGYNEIDLGNGIIYSKLDINSEQNNIGFDKGNYRILSIHNLFLMEEKQRQIIVENIVKILNELLSKMKIKKTDVILICGLGNEDIIADSFGVNVCKNILPTMNIKSSLTKSKVCQVMPNVKSITGLDTYTIVNGLANQVKAKLIILIDSLLTNNVSRIGHSFQISSCGITPGGAIKFGKKISEKSTGIKCLTIGVPFMVDLYDLAKKSRKHLIMSPKDNYSMIEYCSKIISDSINIFFNPTLTLQEIYELKRPF